MLKWTKLEKEEKKEELDDLLNSESKEEENIINYNKYKLAFINEKFDKRNTELSINEYVRKIKKQLILIEKLKQNKGFMKSSKNSLFQPNSPSKIRGSIYSKEELIKKVRKSTVNDISNIIWNEPEQYGQKVTMALNLLQIPFNKYRINSMEMLEEIDFIFNKRTRTTSEMIYLQHLLTLYDVVPAIYRYYDLIEPNEILFNMAICLNMHRFNTNDLIFKYGEFSDKLFFVLSGSVSLIEPVERKSPMTISEYISYLRHLETIEEYELIRKIIENNKVYRNNDTIIKIRMDNEKHIRKKYLQKMKIIKDINKLQDYSLIEVNLNVDINSTIRTVSEDFYIEETISPDDYMSRVIPKHLLSQKNTNLSLCSSSSEEKDEENEEEEYPHKRYKNMIKYYQYSLVKKVEPFNVFGEILIDEDEKNKNNDINSNNNNFKKRELTAICNETSRILYLDINNWQKYYKVRQEAIKMKNFSTILDIPFLREINKEYFRSKIFEHFSLFNYKIGEYVFKQNEKRKKIYFIRSGEVQLIMRASLYDINNIIDNKFDKNDINYRNNMDISKDIKDIDYTDINYLINKINNEKKTKTWRILGIYPKDVLGLNEVVDENNNYFFSAKCSSYNNEIYEIDYNKFIDMITEDCDVKSLLIQYNNKKMNLILNRFKNLRKHYINEKLKIFRGFKNYIFSKDKFTINNYPNHFTCKKKFLKRGMLNNIILKPTLSSNKDLYALSDNCLNTNSKNSENLNNYFSLLDSKTATSSNNNKEIIIKNSISSNDECSNEKNKKIKNKKINKLKIDIDNNKTIDSNNNHIFSETHTFFNTRSQKLIRFKDINKIFNKHKKSKENKNKNKKLTYSSFFNSYIKEVKTFGLDSAKKPKITPFSNILFSLADNYNKKLKNIVKSKSTNNIGCSNPFNQSKKINESKLQINKIECLILDKIIDVEGYSKFNSNDLKCSSKSVNNKNLKKQITIMNKKKQFPQHLIRRFETNRKICYFPEKYLQFVK